MLKSLLKRDLEKRKTCFGLEEKEIGVVGDQISTDVIGANRSKMFPILVKPVDEKDIFITKIKRPLERLIINQYLKTKEKTKV